MFIEYKINKENQEAYLKTIEELKSRIPTLENVKSYHAYKGTDQPELFVETIILDTPDLYHQWKLMLEDQHPRFPWYSILQYIEGGPQKFNMWLFRSII